MRARPKSAILRRPSLVIKRLAGFKSRCNIKFLWRWSNAESNWSMIHLICCGLNGSGIWSTRLAKSWLQYSKTKNTLSGFSPTVISFRVTMFGWFSRRKICISRIDVKGNPFLSFPINTYEKRNNNSLFREMILITRSLFLVFESSKEIELSWLIFLSTISVKIFQYSMNVQASDFFKCNDLATFPVNSTVSACHLRLIWDFGSLPVLGNINKFSHISFSASETKQTREIRLHDAVLPFANFVDLLIFSHWNCVEMVEFLRVPVGTLYVLAFSFRHTQGSLVLERLACICPEFE